MSLGIVHAGQRERILNAIILDIYANEFSEIHSDSSNPLAQIGIQTASVCRKRQYVPVSYSSSHTV